MADAKHYRIGLSDIRECAVRMRAVLEQVKEAALRPGSVKKPPRRTTTQVAAMLGLSKSQFQRRQASTEYPPGERGGNQNWFTIDEIRGMAVKNGMRHRYAQGHGICLTVANFKGGVLKTSTVVTLSQYLAERGLKVLVIDLDPQASATTLYGLSPFLDVNPKESISELFLDENVRVETLTRHTYWPGIDIVPANQYLYRREFALAANASEWGGEIFEYLQQFMPEFKSRYDVILVDTQPSLGFLTSTGVFASDHLLVTVPPSNLDFASSVVFWDLLNDIMSVAADHKGNPKFWESIQVLLTKEESQDKSATFVRGLLAMGCGNWLLHDSVPATRVMTNASSDFNTIYDIERYEGSHQSLKRARELYDKAYSPILDSLNHTWDVWENPDKWEIVMQPVPGELFQAQVAPAGDTKVALPDATTLPLRGAEERVA